MPLIPYRNDIHNLIDITMSDTTKTNGYVDAAINKTLMAYLARVKTEIDSRQSEWDRLKKYTNPYEYIHTIIPNTNNSVSKLKPLSRSYYKMIEMYRLFDLGRGLSSACKTFHLAEGPGGFIEAMCDLRKVSEDTYVGMTLVDETNYKIPGWKKSRNFLDKHPNVVIEAGQTGTGDIINASNLKYCYEKYCGQIELVTGDGGFDFSLDFNHQESVSAKLIFCQIVFAIAVQKVGGNFIIKFFDTFTQVSLDMMYLLSLVYEEVYIVKPNTSRYANSEKYVVCKTFRMREHDRALLVKRFILAFREKEFLQDTRMVKTILNIDISYMYSCKIQEYNAILGQQQIETISSTLYLIDTNKTDRLDNLKKNNIQKSLIWCQKHNIPHNNAIGSSNMFLVKGKH